MINPEELLSNIKRNLPGLMELLRGINSEWCSEDYVYRYYHGSFKVYHLQTETKRIAEALKRLAPKGFVFCSTFQDLMKKGAGCKQFKLSHNENWEKHTSVFLEAFFHARYFLEMAVKYGKKLKKSPEFMPSGWAAMLSLYQRRRI